MFGDVPSAPLILVRSKFNREFSTVRHIRIPNQELNLIASNMLLIRFIL